MSKLKSFIPNKYRPEVRGGRLDKHHVARFSLSCDKKKIKKIDYQVNAICFGPKKDNVLINLENSINSTDRIMVLYYEDLNTRWTYCSDNGSSYFIYKANDIDEVIIKPKSLYIRGCCTEPGSIFWKTLGNFYNFVDTWSGKVICRPITQLSNESKLYQINNSLRESTNGLETVKIGTSYVIKGDVNDFIKSDDNNKYIVKSLSGVRSIVVDSDEYLKWDISSINNLPVMFQSKVNGKDLRVHSINNSCYMKLSTNKVGIDYRYDKNFFNLVDVVNVDTKIKTFCTRVSRAENNILLGIDFIKDNNSYVVLEANPSPGWSAYHESSGITTNSFIQELIRELKSA